jgi:hypothetical protein
VLQEERTAETREATRRRGLRSPVPFARMTDTLTDAERVIVDGPDHAIAAFIESHAAIVDWRDGFEDILDAFSRFLPADHLAMDAEDEDAVLITSANALVEVPLDGEAPFGLDVAAAIARLMPPDFEAHAFRATVASDTHCYLVRPRAWWDAFRARHSARHDLLFAAADELPDRFVLTGASSRDPG